MQKYKQFDLKKTKQRLSVRNIRKNVERVNAKKVLSASLFNST